MLADAPPQVEVVVGRRPKGDHVVHLINHSGHQDRSYHSPLPVSDIGLTLDLDAPSPTRAQALHAGLELPIDTASDGRVHVRLPRLEDFEAIVLSG